MCTFGQSTNTHPHQTIPLDTLVKIKVIQKDTIKLGTFNIYSFQYFNGKDIVPAKFLIDEDIDSLRQPPYDTVFAFSRNYGFSVKMKDGNRLGMNSCRGFNGCYLGLDSTTNNAIYLDYREDSKSPVLRLNAHFDSKVNSR